MRVSAFGLAVLIGMTTSSMAEDYAPSPLAEKIDAIVQKRVNAHEFNGLVRVIHHGQLLFAKEYGKANWETGEPLHDRTRFVLASITKPITATMILLMMERGKLNLDDKISPYLPNPPKSWSSITIRHLLTHEAGIVDYLNTDAILEPIRNLQLSPEQLIETFSRQPLEFAPGSKLKYSNSGYVLLGYILQKITGLPYERILLENIITPLGMTETQIKADREFKTGEAAPYISHDQSLERIAIMNPSILFGCGNIETSMRDLQKFDQALYGNQLLREETRRQMFTPNFEKYGFGFSIRNPEGHRLAYHDGHVSGFANRLARYLDDELSILMLNNIKTGLVDDISNEIATAVFARPAEE